MKAPGRLPPGAFLFGGNKWGQIYFFVKIAL
jgi:hypothetical protein